MIGDDYFLIREHSEILESLQKFSLKDDDLGSIFNKIVEISIGHFDREEETVVILGQYLYDSYVHHKIVERGTLKKAAEEFKIEYGTLLDEHRDIERLLQSIPEEELQKKDVRTIKHTLLRHSEMEEQLLFPSAMLIASTILREDA